MPATDTRDLRSRTGMSQEALARVMGVTLNTVQRWERTNGTDLRGPTQLLIDLMTPPAGLELVKVVTSRPYSEHGDGWEHVALYRDAECQHLLGGNGGPDSAWGRKHGAYAWHREPLSHAQAVVLLEYA